MTGSTLLLPEHLVNERMAKVAAVLDRFEEIEVHSGVVRVLNSEPDVTSTKEVNDESRQHAHSHRRPDRTAQPRNARSTDALRGRALREIYEAEISDLREEYVSLTTFADPHGMWLSVCCDITLGLGKQAVLVIALPNVRGTMPIAWGFWLERGETTWIGPRHTNFPEGSICAFAPDDNAWNPGDSIRLLLAIYVEWTFRHAFLERFATWPGRQIDLGPTYRRLQFRPSEFCGCNSGIIYRDCCFSSDFNRDLLLNSAEAMVMKNDLRNRKPPQSIIRFMSRLQPQPPRICDVHPQVCDTQTRWPCRL